MASKKSEKTFDCIIVGGGTAGPIIAATKKDFLIN